MFASLTLIDWIGILGSLLIAGAYFAVSQNKLDPEAPPFNLLNLAGALFILFALYFEPVPGAILIEVLWVFIALAALTRYALKKR